jgi:hypothetical protein
MKRRILIGEEHRNSIIQKVLSTHIIDKLVSPESMRIVHDNHDFFVEYSNGYQARIHRHAMGQLAGTAGIPRRYVSALRDGVVSMPSRDRHDLLCHVFNTHYTKGEYLDRSRKPTKFLHRTVDGELRGFLSRNFNRRIGSVAMLRPFIEKCQEHYAAPVAVTVSPVKITLQCFLPDVFEPVPGEFVTFGVSYTNSDFGAGRLTVSSTIMRATSGSTSILSDEFSMVHLGALISEEEITLSEATLKKEAETHIAAIKDMVSSVLSEGNISNILKMITYSTEKKITLSALKDKLKDLLGKGELDNIEDLLKNAESGIVDLPPVNSDGEDNNPSLWWAASALGWMASNETDPDKQGALHLAAGRLIKTKESKNA